MHQAGLLHVQATDHSHSTLLSRVEARDPSRRSKQLSPVLLAVLHGLPVVTRMLYESGSCSYTELFRLHTDLPQMIHDRYHSLCVTYTSEITSILGRGADNWLEKCSGESVKVAADYLMKVCSTPRSLKSSCRLVISRCVTVRRQRHRDATYAQLPLTEELRNYVMFSDLTDPDYGQRELQRVVEDSGDSSYDNH